MRTYEIVIRDKKGKLSIRPKFNNKGCYFYFIPRKFHSEVIEGFIYPFKFGPPKYNGKKDKNGRCIYICAAIPVKE